MAAYLIQGSDEWIQKRKQCITATDLPVILEDSPWKTRYKLWKEKVGLSEVEKPNLRMIRGLELEPIARKEFENVTGTRMKPVVVFHSEYPWMMASLDGRSKCQKFIVEIKCASKVDHEVAKKGQIPKKYYAQVQTQLAVTNLKMAYYFSFDGKEGVIVEVNRDDIYIERLIEKAIEFKRCIDQFIPPEMTDKEKREAECLNIEDLNAERLASRYLELGAILDDLVEQREDYKQQLIALARGSNIQGESFKLSKVLTKGRVDYDSILRKHGIDEDLDAFRKTSTESWRISKTDD
jgi:putative phage-type endonuclease